MYVVIAQPIGAVGRPLGRPVWLTVSSNLEESFRLRDAIRNLRGEANVLPVVDGVLGAPIDRTSKAEYVRQCESVPD